MPALVVFAIEVDRTSRLRTFHEAAQIRLRRLKHQMYVVRHKAKQVQSYIIQVTALGKLADETLAIMV